MNLASELEIEIHREMDRLMRGSVLSWLQSPYINSYSKLVYSNFYALSGLVPGGIWTYTGKAVHISHGDEYFIKREEVKRPWMNDDIATHLFLGRWICGLDAECELRDELDSISPWDDSVIYGRRNYCAYDFPQLFVNQELAARLRNHKAIQYLTTPHEISAEDHDDWIVFLVRGIDPSDMPEWLVRENRKRINALNSRIRAKRAAELNALHKGWKIKNRISRFSPKITKEETEFFNLINTASKLTQYETANN